VHYVGEEFLLASGYLNESMTPDRMRNVRTQIRGAVPMQSDMVLRTLSTSILKGVFPKLKSDIGPGFSPFFPAIVVAALMVRDCRSLQGG
jgi:hypothetical protein